MSCIYHRNIKTRTNKREMALAMLHALSQDDNNKSYDPRALTRERAQSARKACMQG